MYKLIADADEVKRPKNPRATANIFEILSFSWLLDLFKTGRKRTLEETDLYTTLDDHKASPLSCELEKAWTNELAEAVNKNRKPSLLRALIKMVGTDVAWYGILQFINEIVLRIPRSLLFGGILAYFNPVENNRTDKPHAFAYAGALIFSMMAVIVVGRYAQIEMEHCGMKIRLACCSIIYKKALRLSNHSLKKDTIGQVTNLLANDTRRIDMVFKLLHVIWIGPLSTIFAMYLLWREIGVSSLFGVVSVLMIIPLQTVLGRKVSEFRLKIAPRTDERIRLMNEIISGIQVIKMYTWENKFVRILKAARKMEIREIRKSLFVKFIQESFQIFHTRLALLTSILVYLSLGNNINTEKIFVTISFYIIIRFTMAVLFPITVGAYAEFFVSIERIQTFLLSDEKRKQYGCILTANGTTSDTDDKISTDEDSEVMKLMMVNDAGHNQNDDNGDFGLAVSNVSAKWTHEQPKNSLNNIDLTAVPGRLVAIVGPVGAGKSTLIKAILQELPLSEGRIFVRGVISYASQEPWLFNSSVQNNILFNSVMDKERYLQVINVCALETDLLRFPNGDETIIGDRGISLSAGQRARINLARAVYRKADIYLLDDPLSAVDTHVGKHLFEKCIQGFLKEKTCILVTHQIQYLADLEQIVLMDKSNILAQGSYRELQSGSVDFFNLTESLKKTTIADGEEDETTPEEIAYNVDNGPRCLPVTKSAQSIENSAPAETCKFLEGPPAAAETRSMGNVSLSVYLSYLVGAGSAYTLLSVLFACLVTQLLCTGEDYWISYWMNLEDHVFQNVDNGTSAANDKPINKLLGFSISRSSCVLIYVVLNVIILLVVWVRCFNYVSFFVETSKTLHDNMFNAITNAKMTFFNTNSAGRILNRFTRDIGSIDEGLPGPLTDFIYIGFSLIGFVIIIGLNNVYLLIPAFFMGILCYYVGVYYLSLSRSIKRLEAVTRSPVFAHFNESIDGLVTVRAFESEDILFEVFNKHQDLHSSAWYLLISTNNALSFTVDTMCLVYVSVMIMIFLTIDNDWYGGNVGLVITQSLSLMSMLQFGVRQTAQIDNQMISVERVLEYTNVPSETASESSLLITPPKGWPNKGKITFKNLFLSYGPNSPYILKNINIEIRPTEKIGIVGRTGSGKSSLINALYRLATNEGNIFIDDVEIHELELRVLRSKLSIIPQEPVLFSGTMRTNLDPFNEYSDHALWTALDEVQLKGVVEELPGGLNSNVSAGGANFSIGQKQLLCLARAVVRSNKILILDEATANVDLKTDTLIQNTIRNKFKSYTVLTIAHRLNTIMDSDKVLVVDAGAIVEFGSPRNLLKNKDGYFYRLVHQTDRSAADSLCTMTATSDESSTLNTTTPIV